MSCTYRQSSSSSSREAFRALIVPFTRIAVEPRVDVNFNSGWPPTAPDPDPHVAWAREGWEALQPHAGAPMPQFLLDEDPAEVYGGTRLERRRALKDRWDPTNFFRLNQKVPPSAG